MRGNSQNPTSGQQGSFGFVQVDPNAAASRQDAERILASGGSFVDATSKVDAASPGKIPLPIARPADLNVNYGSLDPQQRAELRAQYVGTQAQTTDIATPGPTPNQQVDAAQTNVAIAQATADSANAKYNSALQTFGANDPRTTAFKNDAAVANDSLVTAQSQRDTIIATNPLLDKDPSDATGTASAMLQEKQNAYYAAIDAGDASPSDNTNNISTHVQTQQEIVDQANAVQAAQTASVASINNPVVPDAVADYRAPASTAVSTNSATFEPGATYDGGIPNRDVEYTNTSTLPTFAQPKSPDAAPLTIGDPSNNTTGYSFGNNPVPLPTTTGDPRVGEGTLGGGYNDPYSPPPTDSATPSTPPATDNSYLPIEKPAPVTGTTPAPGSGGATGGSDTPQGSAATGPSAGSC